MKNISPFSNELVQFIGDKKKHTTLFCIKHLLDWVNSIPSEKPLNGLQYAAIEKIKNLPAKSFDKVIEHPAIELWCANIIRTVRHDEELEDDLFFEGLYFLQSILKIEGLERVKQNNNYLTLTDNQSNYKAHLNDTIVIDKKKLGISFFASQPLLLNLLGDELNYPVEKQIEAIQSCFQKGSNFLKLFYPRGYSLLGLINAFSAINNPANVITSCSTDDYNGLVVIAENNPPVLIAEQLVHEATHIHFNNILYSNTAISDLFTQLPAFYSPFTESARPAEKVAHGIFSYSEVLSMWKSLRNCSAIKPEYFCLDEDEVKVFIEKRISELNGRISCALRNLEALLKNDEKKIWKEIFDLFIPKKENSVSNNESLRKSDKLNINSFEMLNNIEKAELLLAINGSKISRISIPSTETGNFSKLLDNCSYFSFASELIISKQDDSLNQFSNVIDGFVSYMDKEERNTDAFVYVGQEPNTLRKAIDLDTENKSGTFFEIPNCCQEYFTTNWEKARKGQNGDLASFLMQAEIEKNNAFVEIPWQLNSFAMYWGGGLTWHFPCSLNCERTISLINRRLDTLGKINTSLCDELLYIQQLPILLTDKRGMGLLEKNVKKISLDNIRWDSQSKIPKNLTELGFDHDVVKNHAEQQKYNNILGENWKYISWQ